MTAVVESYVEIDKESVAWIVGTKVKVAEIATDILAHGSSAEELSFQYPHLSLSQIHAALAYYYAHRETIDSDILRRLGEVSKFAVNNVEEPIQRRLSELRNGK